jgi:hypothetical protein
VDVWNKTSAAGGGGGLEIEPTNAQLHDFAEGGSLVFAIMPVRGEVTQLSHVGEWDTEDYEVSVCLGLPLCLSLFVCVYYQVSICLSRY